MVCVDKPKKNAFCLTLACFLFGRFVCTFGNRKIYARRIPIPFFKHFFFLLFCFVSFHWKRAIVGYISVCNLTRMMLLLNENCLIYDLGWSCAKKNKIWWQNAHTHRKNELLRCITKLQLLKIYRST